jgi:hypothetical protein
MSIGIKASGPAKLPHDNRYVRYPQGNIFEMAEFFKSIFQGVGRFPVANNRLSSLFLCSIKVWAVKKTARFYFYAYRRM